ncbi:exopolysaccharide transport family protein [Aquisphaera insulae]|uniref:exopolysaccharide transport family protein n=1 Tax=Aquisphaera insulae TaxID=2712864 RepID=UPI0013EA5A46|nr:polysaccharide biosynthesis tyrosine autokinase [Aquisphaera insulae]
MNTPDRIDANLPARQPAPARPPAQVIAPREIDAIPVASSSSAIDGQQLLRGLGRNWWRILLVWIIVSAPLVYLIYSLVEPTYQATSLVEVQSNQNDPFVPVSNQTLSGSEPAWLKTQLISVTSDPVLDAAFIVDPAIAKFSMFADSKDQLIDLRRKLDVAIIPNTTFIRISLESTNPDEAAKVVNAVANAYKLTTQPDPSQVIPPKITSLQRKTAKDEVEALQEYRKTAIDPQIKRRQDDLLKLAQKGGITVKKESSAKGDTPGEAQPSFDKAAMTEFQSAHEKLLDTNFDLIEAEARLAAMQAQASATPDVVPPAGEETAKVTKAQIDDEFLRDPEVIAVRNQIKEVEDEYEHVRKVAKRASDPALKATLARLDALKKQYEDMWPSKSEQIRQRLQLVTTSGTAPPQRGESMQELVQKIAELKTKAEMLTKLSAKYEIKQTVSNSDAVQATFYQTELANFTSAAQQIERRILQLQFTQDKAAVTIPRIDPARAPKETFNNKRLKFMAILPVVVLGAVLGLFLLLEIRAERVANPDALSSRVQSEVYALPPIPKQRAIGRSGSDDQIDRFIQRLDHLRFAVCGDHHEAEMGRCVLVTSAVGGEGKTTLAAQLAARCGNAGISTLLIDADLRRAALCPLLDVPEGPGLSDALQGDAKVEELVIPVQGGTFHLLSAGTPTPDASRIVQGRNFPMIIAQLRQTYEMIIIDSPPILPVPDALALGRWTDGALLATRFEVSRSPQVERARRQLDNAGIPVLGTVINGLRTSDSYYGRYTYNRQRTPQADPAETI